MVVELKAIKRKETGKTANKRIRKQGFIPAIIYGQKENLNIMINHSEFIKLVHHITKSTIINLKLEDKNLDVLIKDYDKDYITDKYIHIDFYELAKDTTAVFSIPLHFIGTPIGVKEGGILVKHLTELKVECLPKDIVPQFDIDVSNLKIGNSLHVKDLPIDKNKYKIVTHLDIVVVHISGVEKEEAPTEEAAASQETPKEASQTAAKSSSEETSKQTSRT